MQYNENELKEIFSKFLNDKDGTFQSATPYGSGHINDTYKVSFLLHDKPKFYILQRINHNVFPNPKQVMENVVRVTHHLSNKIKERGGEVEREVLTLLPTKEEEKEDGQVYYTVVNGNYWRVYNFISDATAYEIGADSNNDDDDDESEEQTQKMVHVREEAAAAFARFQRDVSDIPPPRLHETISKFGDSSFRFQQLEEAVEANVAGRASACEEEIKFCLARKEDAYTLIHLLQNKSIPERVVHYDTKINNVLMDDVTKRGLCVIDLDTTMPGMAIYDFGDCVRAATALSAEDEIDLKKVGFSLSSFDDIVRGYLSVAHTFLTKVEMDHLAFAAKIVTFTIGLRFFNGFFKW
mmetsp:Transcript_19532/g.28392  ORF Transcript_19532/g.28392 Transcript_19532/m.28392 type:complete len:352 (-) Transcript_19532:250-1305(-)